MRPFATATLACLAALGALALQACRSEGGLPARLPGAGSTSGTTVTPTAVQLAPGLFATIEQGTSSGIDTAESHLIVDPIAFDRVWNRHTSNTRPAPRFNFHDYAIVATFAGWKPTGGHATEVVAVSRDVATDDVHATVRDSAPGSWRHVTTALTEPFHIVSVDRPTKAGAKIVVHKQTLLDFETIEAGTQSLIGQGNPSYTGDLLVFRTARDFAGFWAGHSTDPVPAVNFATDMVVAVLAGYRGSFGHTVVTSRLLHDAGANEIRVDFRVDGYRGGAAPPQVTETPYQILRVAQAPGAIRAEVRASLPPTEIARGEAAVYNGAATEVEVARDQAAFDGAIDSRITGGGPLRPQPFVDFGKEQAILVFLGARASTAWGVEVAAVSLLEDGEIEILVHTNAPMGRPMATPTSPWQIVKLPKTYSVHSVRVEDVTPRP